MMIESTIAQRDGHATSSTKPATTSQEPIMPIITTQTFKLASIYFSPLKQSIGSFEYILVVMDHFACYAQTYATKNKAAQTIANKLAHFYSLFWVPYAIPS